MRHLLVRIFSIAVAAVLFTGCGANYYLKQGKTDFRNLSYAKAKTKFNKAIEMRPESYESLKMLALTHKKLDDFAAAEKAYQLAMNYPQVTLEDKFNYGKMLMSNNKHERAELIFREYLKVKPDDKVARAMVESCQFIELFKDDTAKYKVSPLPMLSNLSMFSPAIYGDGLAFTAEKEMEGRKGNPWTGKSYYDIYYMKNNGTTWNEQMPVDKIFNGKFHDGPIAFNKANDFAVFTRSYTMTGKKAEKDEQNFNNMFLYSANKTDGVWGEVTELPFNNIDFSCMHPSLTPNGDTLYFASDMPGGQGENDIYMSTNASGSWSAPKNLGPEINTKANEVFPTFKNGGKLYFASDGHPSLGGLDIFSSTSKDGMTWRKPRNLNYPVNSTADDFSFVYAGEDSVGYFSSNRQGVDKIYEFKKRPAGNVFVNGSAMDENGSPLSGVTIKLIDQDTGETVQELVTGADGKFELQLLPDHNYRIEGVKDGYFTQSYERSTVNQYEDEEVDIMFTMPKLIVTDPGSGYGVDDAGVYKIDNIYYDFDASDIRPDAALELDKIVKLLNDNPSIKIELHSHTDARGKDSYNMELSNRRARAAKAYLIQKGVAVGRVGTKGFGETRIVNRCVNGVECEPEEYEENRRTEFIVTSK